MNQSNISGSENESKLWESKLSSPKWLREVFNFMKGYLQFISHNMTYDHNEIICVFVVPKVLLKCKKRRKCCVFNPLKIRSLIFVLLTKMIIFTVAHQQWNLNFSRKCIRAIEHISTMQYASAKTYACILHMFIGFLFIVHST